MANTIVFFYVVGQCRIHDGYIAIHTMSGTGDSGIVGAHRHFHFVQDTLVDVSVLGERAIGLVDPHIDWANIVRGADDEINL